MTTNGRRGLAGWGGIWRHHCCRSWISFVAAISTRYLGTRRTAACFNMVMPKWRQQLKQTRWRPVLSGCQLIFVCKANPGIIQNTVDGQNKASKKRCVTYFWVKYSWKVITAWRTVREDAVFSPKSVLCWWKLPTSTLCKALGECGPGRGVWLIQKRQLEGKSAQINMKLVDRALQHA